MTKKKKFNICSRIKAKVWSAVFGIELKIKSIPYKIQTMLYGH